MDSHECTQPVESQLDETDGETETLSPWGRLTPTCASLSSSAIYEFIPRSALGALIADHEEELDVYILGRNQKCDVVIDDSRVSGCHCRIYRSWNKRPGLSSRLLAYVEDTSSNGTFVNKTKLRHRERRLLSSGDELTFLSPKIPEARSTAYVYVNVSHLSADSTVSPAVAAKRSLTLAASALDRRLENDYQLFEELGSGTIGKVYRAVDRTTGEAFAAKIVPTRQFALQRSFCVEDLLQEARMLRNLSHPAIVKVCDAYNEVDSFAIVMQLVEGGDLFDRVIKRGRYPEPDARDAMRHLLSALAYLHALGIAHRDVKPENILLRTLDSDVDVLLTDFGLAKGAAVGSQGCKTFCGTPQYLAPEVMERQIQGSLENGGYDGAAADIWSVGIVLFVMLSGTQPTNSELEYKRSACRFDDDGIWSAISTDAKQIIQQLTSITAIQRPSAASTLLMPWFSQLKPQLLLPSAGCTRLSSDSKKRRHSAVSSGQLA